MNAFKKQLVVRSPAEARRARRLALQRARRCYTCRVGVRDREAKEDACVGCGELIGYYSCAPGYCRACAHDPSWVSFTEAFQ